MKCPIHGCGCEYNNERYFCQDCGFSWTTAEILKYEQINEVDKKMNKLKKNFITNIRIHCFFGTLLVILIIFLFLSF